jgi:predicted DNA-binding transcriptional regulator AlpA
MAQTKQSVLTIEQAAARRGCSASTIWRRARRGELTLQRVLGRTVISITEVDALEMPDGGGRWSKRAKEDTPA